MLCGGEITAIHAHQTDCQENRTHQNMEPVKAGRHIEGRRIDPLSEAKGRMTILINLYGAEAGPQDDRKDQPLDCPFAIPFPQGVVRPGHCAARQQQDQGVQQWQIEGVQGLNMSGWPLSPCRLDTGVLDGVSGENTDIEIRPEKGREKHHFRCDEKRHAIA